MLPPLLMYSISQVRIKVVPFWTGSVGSVKTNFHFESIELQSAEVMNAIYSSTLHHWKDLVLYRIKLILAMAGSGIGVVN